MNKKYIKFNLAKVPCNWWLRSAGSYNDNVVGDVDYVGIINYDIAYNNNFGVLPACIIL